MDQLLVKSMVEVSHRLNKKVIAEFVESEEVLDMLRGYGVDYVQGYLIGKPAAEMERLLRPMSVPSSSKELQAGFAHNLLDNEWRAHA
jgi:EAL domain-containing protein (putative c-di-GMP-specific phosphodiesterase class I)